jgi:hypothetical protein
LAVTAAAAQAAVWKDKGTNVTTSIQIGLTGGSVFEAFGGTVSCTVRMTISTSGGSTAQITKYEMKSCIPAGSFKTCKVLKAAPKSLPWTVDVNSTDLTTTGENVLYVLGSTCAFQEYEFLSASTTITLNTPSSITEIEFARAGTSLMEFGSMTVDSPNSGTYGIG